jgi:hypothetical protein
MALRKIKLEEVEKGSGDESMTCLSLWVLDW